MLEEQVVEQKEEQVEEQVKEEEEQVLESAADELRKHLKDFPNAPSRESIDQWKLEYGELYVSGLSEVELYVWHPLDRKTWLALQMELMERQAEAQKDLKQDDPNLEKKIVLLQQEDQWWLEYKTVEACVLWQSHSVPLDKTKGGTIAFLNQQIMTKSNFYSPEAASILVAKL